MIVVDSCCRQHAITTLYSKETYSWREDTFINRLFMRSNRPEIKAAEAIKLNQILSFPIAVVSEAISFVGLMKKIVDDTDAIYLRYVVKLAYNLARYLDGNNT